MDELQSGSKAKVVSVFLTVCGLFMSGVGIILLFDKGVTRIPLQLIGWSFFFWAFAASPKIMLRSMRDKSKIKYSLLSKMLLLIGAIILVLSFHS